MAWIQATPQLSRPFIIMEMGLPMARIFKLALVVVVVVMALVVQPALAVIRSNTIDPNATLGSSGRTVEVSGPIACDEGERLWILVGVAQASSGAWGTGLTVLKCTGELQRWSVKVLALSGAAFEPGHAQACAFGVTRKHATTTDTRQWCAANGVSLG